MSTAREDRIDASVEVDLAELLFDAAQASSDNVFLEPAPPDLCPWSAQVEGAKETITSTSFDVSAGPAEQDGSGWDAPLPRFTFLSPEPSQVRDVASRLGLPRFSDAI
jgi:hypothetical protein